MRRIGGRPALRHTRANVIRHEPGAIGPRHVGRTQDETFVPVRGAPDAVSGRPADAGFVVFVCGAPAERTGADVIDSAV